MYFHFFPLVKMAAKYAKVNSVISLNTDFEQVPHVQIF